MKNGWIRAHWAACCAVGLSALPILSIRGEAAETARLLAVGHPANQQVLIPNIDRSAKSHRRTTTDAPTSGPSIATPSVGAKQRNMFQRFGDAVGGALSKAWKNMGRAFKGPEKTSKPKNKTRRPIPPKNDPLSLSNKPAEPDAKFYVAVARLHESKNNLGEAENNYKHALEQAPDNLEAMLGYARLLDRQGKLAEATQQYLEATRRHPREATAFNDLGLCLARQGKLDESIQALRRAIDLQPQRKLYRNNLATVLVEMGRYDEALKHLVAVHGESIGHYNLGYLLSQKGDRRAAAQHFARAVEIDPQFAEARRWLDMTASRPGNETQAAPRASSGNRSAAAQRAVSSDQVVPQATAGSARDSGGASDPPHSSFRQPASNQATHDRRHEPRSVPFKTNSPPTGTGAAPKVGPHSDRLPAPDSSQPMSPGNRGSQTGETRLPPKSASQTSMVDGSSPGLRYPPMSVPIGQAVSPPEAPRIKPGESFYYPPSRY